jgi:hypothetical protein
MESIQLLFGSLLICLLCLVMFFSNSMFARQQLWLIKIIGALSAVVVVYSYSQLEDKELDCIWGVRGGISGGISGGDPYKDSYDEASDLFARL